MKGWNKLLGSLGFNLKLFRLKKKKTLSGHPSMAVAILSRERRHVFYHIVSSSLSSRTSSTHKKNAEFENGNKSLSSKITIPSTRLFLVPLLKLAPRINDGFTTNIKMYGWNRKQFKIWIDFKDLIFKNCIFNTR